MFDYRLIISITKKKYHFNKMDTFQDFRDSSVFNEMIKHEDASDIAKLNTDLPYHLSTLMSVINFYEEGNHADDEETEIENFKTILYKLKIIKKYFKKFYPLIKWDLLISSELHKHLIFLLTIEIPQGLIHIISKILIIYYLPSENGRELLKETDFYDFFIAQISDDMFPPYVPIFLYGIYQMLQYNSDFVPKFIELGAHNYVKTQIKKVVDSFEQQNRQFNSEKEELERLAAEAEARGETVEPIKQTLDRKTLKTNERLLDLQILTQTDMQATITSAAQIIDYMFYSFKQGDFDYDITDSFPFVRELFELENEFVTSMLFHSIEVLLFRYRDFYPKYSEIGFDSLALSYLRKPEKLPIRLFKNAFLFLCCLCHQSPYACEQYLNQSLYESLIHNFDTTPQESPEYNTTPNDLDVILYNLEILIQQSPHATATFVHSGLFDVVASMFQQPQFFIRIQSLMVLTSIIKISEDESILTTVLDTGVLDAYEIMLDIDDTPTQLEFLYAFKHLWAYSQAHNKENWMDLITQKTYLADVLDEMIESENSEVSELANELKNDISEYAEQ